MNVCSALISQTTNGIVSSTIQRLSLRPIRTDEVLIKAEYSSLNYKDALGVTGRGRIFKKDTLVGGIDVAGTVVESKSENIKAGEYVLVTGCGLGEDHDGGYSEYVIENEKNVIIRDQKISARDAMIYGTAGFTAALCTERLLQMGQTPEMGPLLVTGATGGVGSFTIYFFNKLGFEVHALTSKRELEAKLFELGAKKVLFPSQIDFGDRPLETVRYGGAIDNLGGKTLAQIMAHTQLWGNIACVGLAESPQLSTTVMPLILRGVSLIGISSNNTPLPLRKKIWHRLATELKAPDLEIFLSQTIQLDQVLDTANSMLKQQTHGRIVVDLKSD